MCGSGVFPSWVRNIPLRCFLKFLKRYHLRHHYKNPNHGFGVSSPVWDVVFGTKPKES